MVAGVVRRLPVNGILAGAGALVLGVAGLFGGLAPAARPAPPALAAGSAIDGGPWRVTLQQVRLYDELQPLTHNKPGDRWILVLATVEVTTDASRGDMYDIIRLAGVSGLRTEEPERVLLARDGTIVSNLNPRMPERLGYFWEQAPDAPAPTGLDVRVYGKTQRIDTLTGHLEWLDLAVRAQAHLPVDDRRR